MSLRRLLRILRRSARKWRITLDGVIRFDHPTYGDTPRDWYDMLGGRDFEVQRQLNLVSYGAPEQDPALRYQVLRAVGLA